MYQRLIFKGGNHSMYKAHKNDITGKVQTVKEHSENTAFLCEKFSIPELKDVMYMIGLMHDIGKYQASFQQKIDGKNIKVEHSICGAIEAKDIYEPTLNLLMEYCIAGHHSGIPDGGSINDSSEMSTLMGRLKRECEQYDSYKDELKILPLDQKKFIEFILKDCGGDIDIIIDKFAFIVRYCFSCLTDSDSLDTANFCENSSSLKSLHSDFRKCLQRIDNKIHSFVCKTDLQKSRSLLQNQVYDHVTDDGEIYLMNMPTGSGKTLCSMKFALERAIYTHKKRIIYIIPYNSIIDQTVEVFEKLFQEDSEILRHQSTFIIEDNKDYDDDYKKTIYFATENWDAQMIITTSVQFFESVYANKRRKLRKMHNMSDSILIFDEAHLMPLEFLQPCLQIVSFITKYLNSEAVFLTATMPDFERLIKEYALLNSKIVNLIEDKSDFIKFQKCKFQYIGKNSVEYIVEKARSNPSALIIVNKRKTAKEIYSMCPGKKFHLSTYMTAYDRQQIIKTIRKELEKLEKDYPNLSDVPEGRRIIVISTSLIEAGVDLDFFTVFRELTGLDSILQDGGRCNREGKRTEGNVFIFSLEKEIIIPSRDERTNITKGLLEKYDDISCPESVMEYYNKFFFMKKEEITSKTMHQYSKRLESVPFRKYAEEFEMIPTQMVSVIVERDKNSKELIDTLKITGTGNPRKFQNYACSLYLYEFNELLKQHAIDDFGSGIWCLTNLDYYDVNTGINFEANDYFI